MDLRGHVESVDKEIEEEMAHWTAEQDRFITTLEKLKVIAEENEASVEPVKTALAEAAANRYLAQEPVRRTEAELEAHTVQSAAAYAAMAATLATADRAIADDELVGLQEAEAREKAEVGEDEAKQHALFESSDAAVAAIGTTREENAAELVAMNVDLASDDAAAASLKALMVTAAEEMGKQEEALSILRAEHVSAKVKAEAMVKDMGRIRSEKAAAFKVDREESRSAAGLAADREQAKVLAAIEKQEIANNAAARENIRKLAKEGEAIAVAAEVTAAAERVLMVTTAEADFCNGKETDAVHKEQQKNDSQHADLEERNQSWMRDLDGARADLEVLKEQLRTIGSEDVEYAKKLSDKIKAREYAISAGEKENRQTLIDERKDFSDQIGKASVRLVQEDLDEMSRITLGRSALEEASTAREAFEEEFGKKLDAAGAVQEKAEARLYSCDQRVKAAAGQEALGDARARAEQAAEARANLGAEHLEAQAEFEKRVANERQQLEERVMTMRDAFGKSKTAQTISLFERVSRFNTRQQLSSAAIESARLEVERRTSELAATRTDMADAIARWPDQLAARHVELETIQAEEAAIPVDDLVRTLELRSRRLAAEATTTVAPLEEPDRAVRFEEAAIAAASSQLKIVSSAETAWSTAEGARLARAEVALQAWSMREEDRITEHAVDGAEAIDAMEALTRESMEAERGITTIKADIFAADHTEAADAANRSLAETSAVSAALAVLRKSLHGCVTMFKDEESNFEKQSREIEKDTVKSMRSLDFAERDKEKRIIQKKADLEQRKTDGLKAASQHEEEMARHIQVMGDELEVARVKDAEDLEARKARPAKKQKELDAGKERLAKLEARYAEEKKKWDEVKKQVDGVLLAIKTKRDDVASTQAKLVAVPKSVYDKALGTQTKKEETLRKHEDEYTKTEQNAEEGIVQSKSDEVEAQIKRLLAADNAVVTSEAAHEEVIVGLQVEADAFRASTAVREGEHAAADVALDAVIQPFRDRHCAAESTYTDAASVLQRCRDDATAAADAKVIAAESHARTVQGDNMRASEAAARLGDERAGARSRASADAADAISTRRATLGDETRAAADVQQSAEILTAQLTAALLLRRQEAAPEDRLWSNAVKNLELAADRLEASRVAVVDGHPKNVARAEKVHAKDLARLVLEKQSLEDELAAGIAELNHETLESTGAWKADAASRIAVRRAMFDDALANSKALLDARVKDFVGEADEEVAAITDEVTTAEAEHMTAVTIATEKREARESSRAKARVDARDGRELRLHMYHEEYENARQQVSRLVLPLDDAETEYEEAMVGIEASAHILKEEQFEQERMLLAEEMQGKKREMAAHITAERERSKEATVFFEKQQERAILRMEAEAAAERARVAAEMATIEAERLMLEAEQAEIEYTKGEAELREIGENLLNIPTQRPSSAKGKVGTLREEIASTSDPTDEEKRLLQASSDITDEEMAAFDEEKRMMQVSGFRDRVQGLVGGVNTTVRLSFTLSSGAIS